MNLTAIEIARKLNGRVNGNEKNLVTNLEKLEYAKPGSICFLSNLKYTNLLSNTLASVILVPKNFKFKSKTKATLVHVEDPYKAFMFILNEVSKNKQKNLSGIHSTAIIHPEARISKDAYIGPYVTIGSGSKIGVGVCINANCFIGSDVKIENETLIYPRVSIMDQIEIGKRCIIHSGVVIGSDGFGFISENRGEQSKIPQLGNVIIKDDVEIGANTTIDRATLGSTLIEKGVKLDNLIQIGHNVEIGSNTVIAAQSGIAGSTKIGKRCTIGGQVGIIGHLVLGDDVKIQGQTGVINNIPNGKIYQGTPGIDFRSFYKSYSIFKKLPNFQSRLYRLEKILNK